MTCTRPSTAPGGTAIGVLMRELSTSEVDAFHLKARASQQRNRTLRDAADRIVDTGVAPD